MTILNNDGEMVCSFHGLPVNDKGNCPHCRRLLIRKEIDLTSIELKRLNERLPKLERELFEADEEIKKL